MSVGFIPFGILEMGDRLTFMTWVHHLEWLELQGIHPDDLDFIWALALEMVNALDDPRGVTMEQLGFGSLHSVRLVEDRLRGVDGTLYGPRIIDFGSGFVNPYEQYTGLFDEDQFIDIDSVITHFAPAA